MNDDIIIMDNTFGSDMADFNDEDSAERIGHRIRKIRESKKIKLADLAKSVGISQDMLQKYENGQRKPKTSRLKEIAGVLGVSTLALTDPVLTTYDGSMYALFELEEKHGLSLVEKDGEIYMMFKEERTRSTMQYYIKKWYEKQESVRNRMENASKEERVALLIEYLDWEWTFPDALIWKPSVDDKKKEKEALEKRLRELNEELKKNEH